MSDKVVERKAIPEGSMIGIDVNKPFEALDQLRGAETWELMEIVTGLVKMSANVNTLGQGLIQELAKRAKTEMEKEQAGDVQAGGDLKQISVEDLARMVVTSEGN